jgi:hypothetical protein
MDKFCDGGTGDLEPCSVPLLVALRITGNGMRKNWQPIAAVL